MHYMYGRYISRKSMEQMAKSVEPQSQSQPQPQRSWLGCGRGLNSNVILRLCYVLILVKALSLAVDVLLSESGSPQTVFRVSTVKNLYLFPIMRYNSDTEPVPTPTDPSPIELSMEAAEEAEEEEREEMNPGLSPKDMSMKLTQTLPKPTGGLDAASLGKGAASAKEGGMQMSVPYRPLRSRYNVSFGVCLRINSLDDMRKFKFNWLPSFVTSLTRKETSKFRFTLYMGLSRSDLIRFNLDFLRPQWFNLRPITDKSLVQLLGIAARLNDFVLAVNPNGTFTTRYWAMLALRRMNRIEPLGGSYLNLSTANSGIEGLIMSSRVFNALQLVNQQPNHIASFLIQAYKDSPMRGGRTFYRPSRNRFKPWNTGENLPKTAAVEHTLQRTIDVRIQHASLKYVAGRGVDALETSYYQHFKAAQSEAVKNLQSSMPRSKSAAQLNLLIVSTVSSKPESVLGFRKIVSHFSKEQARQDVVYGTHDDVKFMLNFYEEKSTMWNDTLQEHSGFVLKQVHGYKCKIQLWAALSASMTRGFDYVWLMDDDLDLTFYNWELVRLILKGLDPLVAAPGIIPLHKRGRSTWWRMTRAQAQVEASTYSLSVARNVDFIEVMAPMISTKFWPLIYDRLQFFNLTGVYCIDCYWSQAANEWAGKRCGLRAPIIVMDLSPIIHTDRRTLGKVFAEQVKEGVRKRYAGCVRGPIESNLDVSEFGWDILKPRVSSSEHDLSAHKVLKMIQRKGLRCPAEGRYQPGNLWSPSRIAQSGWLL